jgi:heme-degrading monooxygenase HmoA
MFLVLWEFHVKPGCEERFERVYGPGGDWSQLFRSDPHYRETRLLRDPARPNCYTTLDFWDSREAYESFKELHHAEYLALDKICEELTLQERHLGSFTEITEP